MSDSDRTNNDGQHRQRHRVWPSARGRRRSARRMYKVLMLNDDYTPMEFVVHVLERFLRPRAARRRRRSCCTCTGAASESCASIHTKVAETKVTQVTEFARRNQHPLRCTLEKE
jgi:ATP-dependent Clp protease adaptor protein ClpS